MQTPVTPKAGLNAEIKRPHAAALKRDINLISTKETHDKLARRGLFILAGIVFALGFAYLAIYLPLQQANTLDAQLKDMNSKLAAYSDVDAQFTDLTAKLKTVQEMLDSATNAQSEQKGAYQITKLIESACPDTVQLLKLTFSTSEVKLSGVAIGDKDVAQLLANLQSCPDFSSVLASSVTDLPPEQSPAIMLRAFEITAYFPEALPTAKAAPAPAPTASKGGN